MGGEGVPKACWAALRSELLADFLMSRSLSSCCKPRTRNSLRDMASLTVCQTMVVFQACGCSAPNSIGFMFVYRTVKAFLPPRRTLNSSTSGGRGALAHPQRARICTQPGTALVPHLASAAIHCSYAVECRRTPCSSTQGLPLGTAPRR